MTPDSRCRRWAARRACARSAGADATDLEGRALDVANNEFLLRKLGNATDRRARYVCVAAFIDDAGHRTFRGETEGEILDSAARRGRIRIRSALSVV